jgi:hypothetical protein
MDPQPVQLAIPVVVAVRRTYDRGTVERKRFQLHLSPCDARHYRDVERPADGEITTMNRGYSPCSRKLSGVV